MQRLAAKLVGRRAEAVLGVLAAAGLIAAAIMGLVVAPPDATQGNIQRLMYVHVPSAWLAYLSFGVVFVCSIAYLVTKKIRYDRVAHASAEIGVVFTALCIVLGSLWGKPVWGAYWTWDPRLTTTAIMLLMYVGYLAVRRLPDNPARRARWAAVVGIVAFADVPIVQLSVEWWRSLHQGPTIRLLGESTIASIMAAALFTALAAFTLLYLYLMVVRLRVGRLEERALAEALSPRIGRPTQELLDEQEAARVG
jgi:heme exporter protein C